MVTKQFTFQLKNLKCIKETDQNTGSEPYIWALFFKSQGEISNPNKTVDFFSPFTPEFRTLIPDNITNGMTVPIHPLVGIWNGDINLSNQYKILGCVIALLEEDNTPFAAIKAGKDAFVDEVKNLITQKINTLDLSPVSEDEISNIESKISSAVESNLSFFQKFKNQDDPIGFTYKLFVNDEIVNTPLFAFNDIKSNSGGEHYIIEGSLKVRNIIPDIEINICKSQKTAVEEKKQKIEGTFNLLRATQRQLQTASPGAKAVLIKRINELGEEIGKLQVELNHLEDLLEDCQNRLPHRL
jgi:hypothetical protein